MTTPWLRTAIQLGLDRRDNMADRPGWDPPVTPGEPVTRQPGPPVGSEPARAPGHAGGPALRRRLKGSAGLLGTFSVIPSADVIELIALAGFDFVILDMEHGPYTLDLVHSCLLAAAARGMATVVRVPELNPATIGAALDVGADGVLVPQVESADMARMAVAAARFAPHGTRGSNPWVRAARYAGDAAWLAESNANTVVMVMVEGTEALRDIDQILAVEGLDGIFLGPVDMSHALGVPGQPEHPRVLDTLVDVAGKASAAGMSVAVFAPDASRAHAWRTRGLPMVACGVDSHLILKGLAGTVRGASAPA